MKKTDLRKMIREEYQIVLKEDFNNQRVFIDIKKAIMNAIRTHINSSPRKKHDPNMNSLNDAVGHSALNIVKYLDFDSYMT